MHLVFGSIAFQSTYWRWSPIPARSATRWSQSILSRFLDRKGWSGSPKFGLSLFFRCFHSPKWFWRSFARMSPLRISLQLRSLMAVPHRLSFSCRICGGSCIFFPFFPRICCIFCPSFRICPTWKVGLLRFQLVFGSHHEAWARCSPPQLFWNLRGSCLILRQFSHIWRWWPSQYVHFPWRTC